jgi:hypothetical protein
MKTCETYPRAAESGSDPYIPNMEHGVRLRIQGGRELISSTRFVYIKIYFLLQLFRDFPLATANKGRRV